MTQFLLNLRLLRLLVANQEDVRTFSKKQATRGIFCTYIYSMYCTNTVKDTNIYYFPDRFPRSPPGSSDSFMGVFNRKESGAVY
jgi:hypothetical protein